MNATNYISEDIFMDILLKECSKHIGWTVYNFGNEIIITTPYSKWKFKAYGNKIALYHRNTACLKNSHKYGSNYHNQNKSFDRDDIPNMVDYISRHDKSYLNTSKQSRLNQLFLQISA